MRWSKEDQEWVPDPDASKTRKAPYVPARNRPAPAPRGRPPEGKKWSAAARAYVISELPQNADIGKTKFKIEVPPQPRPVI